MNQIIPRLYLGNYPDALSLGQENPNGVTAVLCVNDDRPATPPVSGIQKYAVPLSDDDAVSPQHFAQCVAWLLDRWTEENTILIHCAAGVNRSVVITAIFLVVIGVVADADAAIALIRKQRPAVTPPTATDQGCPKPVLLQSGREWLAGRTENK